MSIRIEGLLGILLLAFLIWLAWWFFGSIFSMTLGRFASYVIVGLIGYALGRET